jgi:hypothetical protein
MFGAKLTFWLILGLVVAIGSSWLAQRDMEPARDLALRQFEDSDAVARDVRATHWGRNTAYAGAFLSWAALGALLFAGDVWRLLTARRSHEGPRLADRRLMVGAFALIVLPSAGCYRPFEPVQLETIGTNEEGFLIPYTGDTRKQASTGSEEYLKANLVFTKQVQIPQQWVPKGYETLGPNGEWRAAAKLIKVDKSPVTREWTADPNSGTSNQNEAIWVMTADQVEWSTGWTCTARIASRDDAVKFLHNYPNGSLQEVMDREIRAKLQAAFGLAVTDLPMDVLRKQATPVIKATVADVTRFFADRGITITNLGIAGGFVYKDKTILDTMVKVFNAEQERAIAKAATDAQEEKNKRIEMEAEGKAQALLTEKTAEARGIQAVADAKAYEIQKATGNLPAYLSLKQLELEQAKLQRWDGRFPVYFLGGGGSNTPDLLLNVPVIAGTGSGRPGHAPAIPDQGQ